MHVTGKLRALLAALTVSLAVVSCGTGPSAPQDVTFQPLVMNGEQDGTRHPNVALLVFYDANDKVMWRCTGTLVDANTILTAGHCVANDPGAVIAYARAYFEPTVNRTMVRNSEGGYVGTAIPHPLYGTSFPNTYDIGVVELHEPVTGIQPAAIAPLGYLNGLDTQRGTQDTSFVIVGYGLQGVKPVLISELTRYVGGVQLVNLRNALTNGYNIQVTSNRGNGTGGSGLCFGDSGGAVFHGDTNIIVAVNSFVLNGQCVGSGFSYRTDTHIAYAFLNDYVDTLPTP